MNQTGIATESKFQRLIAPCETAQFFAEYFERKPIIIPASVPGQRDQLVSWRDVSDYLERGDVAHPYVRLVKNGQEFDFTSFTHDIEYKHFNFRNVIDKQAVVAAFREGASIVIMHAHRAVEKIGSLCSDLQGFFAFPVQANVYVTPSHSTGYNRHFDRHDVFVLQVNGHKDWELFESAVHLPLESESTTEFHDAVHSAKRTHQVTLRPGDLLYIPRGFVHQAKSTDTNSTHVTLGLMAPRGVDLLDWIVDTGKHTPELRKSYPRTTSGSIDSDSLREQLKAALSTLVDENLDLALLEFAKRCDDPDALTLAETLFSDSVSDLERS